MMKTLRISPDLALPLSAVTATTVVYGGKGMGKTNFGAVLVEELARAELRWSVIDPMGVWWGMRHSADGKGSGVECLILGGAHGDIPIEPTGGAVIADLVADEKVSVILDISRKANGEMWAVAERIRFMNDYGKQLFRRQGSLIEGKRREPLCQIVDEAARYIPQQIRAGNEDVAHCANTWSTIVEEGRNVGLGVVLLTQRSARLNKDVAELADLMLAFRTVGPNSIAAVIDWLGAHIPKERTHEMIREVRSLPVGSCLAVSPGWLEIEKVIAVRMRTTFDSSATPKPGDKAARVKGPGAKPDLAVYAARMKETIERASLDDPRALRRRIAELEGALSKAATKPAVPTARPLADPAMMRENEDLRRRLDDLRMRNEEISLVVADLVKAGGELNAKLGTMRERVAQVGAAARPKRAPIVLPGPKLLPEKKGANEAGNPWPAALAAAGEKKRAQVAMAAQAEGGKPLSGTALKIAQIVAGYGVQGKTLSRKVLAVMCGATYGGSFANRLSEARMAGAITTDRGAEVEATSEGVARYAGQFVAPETTAEVIGLWRSKLGKVALQIVETLAALGGEPIARAQLAQELGQSYGGSFANRLSEVRTAGLLVDAGSGMVAANKAALFL